MFIKLSFMRVLISYLTLICVPCQSQSLFVLSLGYHLTQVLIYLRLRGVPVPSQEYLVAIITL